MNSEYDDKLPQELIDKLVDENRSVRFITAKVDREIESLAEAHFAERKAARTRARPAWIAVAASVLVAVFIVQTQQRGVDSDALRLEDLDGSGRVDIVDVLALARQNPNAQQTDIDALASALVALSPKGDAS
jgi:hypothetical protein